MKFNQLLKRKELDQKHQITTKQTDAKIANDISIASSKKEIELAKIQSELEKNKFQMQKFKIDSKNKEKNLEYNLQKQKKDLEFNLKKQENINTLSSQKFIIVLGSVLVMVFTFVLFIYYNNKRKDKLRVYEDNLNKYFREKENQAKIEIAGKILDTIASGKLSEEQENRLISSLGTNSKDSKVTLLQENKKPKVNVIHDLNEIDDIKQ